MAEFDRGAFAQDLHRARAERGLSFGQAVAAHPSLDKAMLSRAIHQQHLSAGNVLLMCRIFGLEPFAYIVERKRLTLKAMAEQAVTRSDQRETRALNETP